MKEELAADPKCTEYPNLADDASHLRNRFADQNLPVGRSGRQLGLGEKWRSLWSWSHDNINPSSRVRRSEAKFPYDLGLDDIEVCASRYE
jgi:hypothetical protein